jgi:hypothetical protein
VTRSVAVIETDTAEVAVVQLTISSKAVPVRRNNYEQTLITSFKALFPDAPLSSNTLTALEIQDLKDAYRRLAKKYHPDVAGKNTVYSRTFTDIVASYEILTRFVVEQKMNATKVSTHQRTASSYGSRQSRSAPSGTGQGGRNWRFTQGTYESGPASTKGEQSQASGSSAEPGDSARRQSRKSQAFVQQPPPDPGMKHEYFHKGDMPQQRMQLGMYLYHKGIISYQALVRALAWQRSCRPPFGELAKAWGFMTDAGVQATLRDVNATGKFGDRAMALGHLRKDQRGVVVLHQLSLQPAIGRYFVANRIVTEQQLLQCLAEMSRHNSTHQKS